MESEKPRIESYRDLVAWQKAMELAEATYQWTKALPDDERFGLISQMRRAAVAVPSNIAEGYARHSRADYIRFLRIARGSLAELSTQRELAQRLHALPPHDPMEELMQASDRLLNRLIQSLAKYDP